MIQYSTTEEMILNKEWIEKNGSNWSSGRLEVDNIPDKFWGIEYRLEPMDCESWDLFSDWLWNYSSEEVLSRAELIDLFETETKHKIVWLKNEKV